MGIRVWANGPEVPGLVCADARLTDRDRIHLFTRKIASTDQQYGQTGWDIGLNFRSLDDLASQLTRIEVPDYVESRSGGGCAGPAAGRRIRCGELTRLAIHAHGVAGEVLVNGTSGVRLTSATIERFSAPLVDIGLLTSNSLESPAVILIVGCSAGLGKPGTDLLSRLSRKWPHRKVVGFATLGYVAGGMMIRGGEGCTEPGMRDTNAQASGEADRNAGKYWNSLIDWPWASENSPRAKVAQDGIIIRGGQW